MHRKIPFKEGTEIIPVITFLLSMVLHGSASPPLPSDIHSAAFSAINYLYNEQYKEAEEEVLTIIKKHPAHPAGYFFMAVAIDAWMATHASDKREDEFFRFCELAVEKGEKNLVKNPADEWTLFFIGGAEGYKGTYEARYEHWIAAFKNGWKGVSLLLKLKERNSDIADINYGIGSYEYWRSAMMKSLWWMPGVDDKRTSGIEKLRTSRSDGIFTKAASAASLIDIYMNEKDYKAALRVADESLRHYPFSRLFLFGKAKSLFGLSRFEESETVYQQILTRMSNDPNENRASIALCHLGIAKTRFAAGRYAECIAECDRMKSYYFDNDGKKAMEKHFSEAEELKKTAIGVRKQKKSPGNSNPEK